MAENAVGTIETLDANAEAITYAIMWLRQLEVCPTGLSTAIPPPAAILRYVALTTSRGGLTWGAVRSLTRITDYAVNRETQKRAWAAI